MEFITLILLQSASEEANLTSVSLLRLHLSPAGQSVSHQWVLSSSRRSTTRRTRLNARQHPCFHSCHLQRLASCVITHSRRLLTKTLFTNPSVFTHSSKVVLINLVCSIFFHSGVSVNVVKRVFTTVKKTKHQNIYFWNNNTLRQLWYVPKLNTNYLFQVLCEVVDCTLRIKLNSG